MRISSLSFLLVAALGSGIAAQDQAPTSIEFEAWHACGGVLSPADTNPVNSFGAVHAAPDETLMLYLRYNYQSAEHASAALRRKTSRALMIVDALPTLAQRSRAGTDAVLVLTGMPELPLAYAPGAVGPKVGLLWTEGASLHMVYGPSEDHVLGSEYITGRAPKQ